MWKRWILPGLCLAWATTADGQQRPPAPPNARQGEAATIANATAANAPANEGVRSFEAIAVSSGEIRLYWLAPEKTEGLTGYRIERDGDTIATLSVNSGATGEYGDAGLEPNTTHRYAVVALRGERESTPRVYVERTFAPFPGSETLVGPTRSPYTLRLPIPKRRITPIAAFDVVVMQASSGGVSAALEAAKRGWRVALVEGTTRVGGMPVNGLSASDLRRQEHAAGFFADFRERVRDLYAAEGLKTDGIKYEPRVAHQAMKSLLYAAENVTLYRRARLRLDRGSLKTTRADSSGAGRRIQSAEIEELDANGTPTGRRAILQARAWIDATDSGDLAALGGAPFRIGREARSKAEPHNGVIYYDRAGDKALPGSTGAADKRIQAYSYLLTVKDYGPGADKTIPRPPGYRKEDFVHSPSWKESWAFTSGKMPGAKYELNQHPEGGDIQGVNYGYPTGGYAERARVEQIYRNRVLSYLYYIQTELGQKTVGLPDDEYRDTGGFPPLLYVREGRRVVGEQLPRESDITNARELTRPESVGIGDYPMDSHAVRPKTDWKTPDMGEGEWWLFKYTPWHELPLGILVPQMLDNVWVTTAVSSTHVSFGTYRLEPVRMALGQAAGIGASLALTFGLAARNVPARQIQDELLPRRVNPVGDPNAVLTYFSDVKPGHPLYRQIMWLAARGIRPAGEAFQPDAPTTRAELADWLTRLTERSLPFETDRSGNIRGRSLSPDAGLAYQENIAPYMGLRVLRPTPKRFAEAGERNATVTRAEFAFWLTRCLPPLQSNKLERAIAYTDIERDKSLPFIKIASEQSIRSDVEMLARLGIDSRLWDSWSAYEPEPLAESGAIRLRFRPDAPLTHADAMAALFIAQKWLGPTFFANPVDGKNKR